MSKTNPFNTPVMPDPFDTRTRRRNITRGIISREDIQNHLKSLPDEAENADYIGYDDVVYEVQKTPAPEAPSAVTQSASPLSGDNLDIPDVIPVVEIPQGLLGGQAPEAPQAPQTPEVPQTPQTPEVPQAPEAPQTPQAPEAHAAPEETTEAPETHAAPEKTPTEDNPQAIRGHSAILPSTEDETPSGDGTDENR